MTSTICPRCRHAWRHHEEEFVLQAELTVIECGVNVGMGSWCGCKAKRPEDWSVVEDVIHQIEAGTRLTDAARDGAILGYVVEIRDWQSYASQLRRAYGLTQHPPM